MDQQGPLEHGPETVLTFRPFIDYLRKEKMKPIAIKAGFFHSLSSSLKSIRNYYSQLISIR